MGKNSVNSFILVFICLSIKFKKYLREMPQYPARRRISKFFFVMKGNNISDAIKIIYDELFIYFIHVYSLSKHIFNAYD